MNVRHLLSLAALAISLPMAGRTQDVTIKDNGQSVTIHQNGTHGKQTVRIIQRNRASTKVRPMVRRAGTASNVTINGNNQRRTLRCNGNAVVVNGNNNRLTLMGVCRSLTLNGNRNTIRAASVGSIGAMGNNNAVRWSAGVSGHSPSVSSLGNGNRITRG